MVVSVQSLAKIFQLYWVPVLDAVEALWDGREGGLTAPAGLGLLGVSPVVRGHHEEVSGGEGADELLGRGGILAERGRRDEGGGVCPACLQSWISNLSKNWVM